MFQNQSNPLSVMQAGLLSIRKLTLLTGTLKAKKSLLKEHFRFLKKGISRTVSQQGCIRQRSNASRRNEGRLWSRSKEIEHNSRCIQKEQLKLKGQVQRLSNQLILDRHKIMQCERKIQQEREKIAKLQEQVHQARVRIAQENKATRELRRRVVERTLAQENLSEQLLFLREQRFKSSEIMLKQLN